MKAVRVISKAQNVKQDQRRGHEIRSGAEWNFAKPFLRWSPLEIRQADVELAEEREIAEMDVQLLQTKERQWRTLIDFSHTSAFRFLRLLCLDPTAVLQVQGTMMREV